MDHFDDVDVLIMAAGTGSRMKSGVRKQWLTLCGQPLFSYVARLFQMYGFTSVAIVMHEDDLVPAGDDLREAGLGATRLVAGGPDRQSSVRNGLRTCTREMVLVHDAARPFLCEKDVRAVVARGRATGAATLGHAVRDTLVRAERETIAGRVEREQLYQLQTPQVFRRDWLERAHEEARCAGFLATDDTSVVERLGCVVDIVQGAAHNLKITEPSDRLFLAMWEALRCGSD